ncbi:MAG: nucleotidyl transferase AbiEii/AbiGii toxin family protein [Gammaproteobacteria bacterium]
MELSLEDVRRRILIAMFSDDELMESMVLKGGNALALVHEVGNRASVDMDFSIPTSFANIEDTTARVFRALRIEFESVGYVIFDESFQPKPSQPHDRHPEWWGGYVVEFKIIEAALHAELRDDESALRRRSAVVGPMQRRIFKIDISKHEFCANKVRREIGDYTIYVYSLEMIAIEKLRAICQQMPDYTINSRRSPRARDFYDIHQIVRSNSIALASPENLELCRCIFDAKRVPLALLGEIHRYRDFHEPDWPAVEISISGQHETYDFYFNQVVELASSLEALWVK